MGLNKSKNIKYFWFGLVWYVCAATRPTWARESFLLDPLPRHYLSIQLTRWETHECLVVNSHLCTALLPWEAQIANPDAVP